MVIAGPGTGKTQLLSVRVANILDKHDASANNILCLTFTDAAARNMRERLLSIIGQDAYKVAIFTFHGFGLEMANRFPEYFNGGVALEPIDDLTKTEILSNLVERLPLTSPLTSKRGDDYVWIGAISSAIGALKKADLDQNSLKEILDHNQRYIEDITPILRSFFAQKMSKKLMADLPEVAAQILAIEEPSKLPTDRFPTLKSVLASSIAITIESGDYETFKEFRSNWLIGKSGQHEFKNQKYKQHLESLRYIFEKYQEELEARRLIDFDDMILDLINGVKKNPDLLAEIQEQFQFILVDEYQDTNDAQLELVTLLGDNPIHEGKPNILVVGDDDQSIYRFQGAEVSNVGKFLTTYPDHTKVILKENYRSTAKILEAARHLILQGEDRLETVDPTINKELSVNAKGDSVVKRIQLQTSVHEYKFIADLIKSEYSEDYSSVVIISRNHGDLRQMAAQLIIAEVPLIYDQKENVLEEPMINQVLSFAKLLYAVKERDKAASRYLIEVLSAPYWGISTRDLWQLNLDTRSTYQDLIDQALASDNKTVSYAIDVILEAARHAQDQPLEVIIDMIVGTLPANFLSIEQAKIANKKAPPEIRSALHDYYFSSDQKNNNFYDYHRLLTALRSIRDQVRSWRPARRMQLVDLLDFIEAHAKNKTGVTNNFTLRHNRNAVSLMTAHKAKGLEFNTVFIIKAINEAWNPSKSRGGNIKFPENLNITPAGDNKDDKLRLFYVAMTRAKHQLIITEPELLENGKQATPLEFLEQNDRPETLSAQPEGVEVELTDEVLLADWHKRHLEYSRSADARELVIPIQETYKLSVTHLNSFLDLTNGGPETFLLRNFLRFPQAKNPREAYGSALHHAMHMTLNEITMGKKPAYDKALKFFQEALNKEQTSDQQISKALERAEIEFKPYFVATTSSLTKDMRAELSFSRQNCVVGDARITGNIDRIVPRDKKVWHVVDIKTASPSKTWKTTSQDKLLKLWRYKNQLIFYNLLVSTSRDYSNHRVETGTIEFAVPDDLGKFISLPDLEITAEDIIRMKSLIRAMWKHVQDFTLPDTSKYSQDFKGIQQFEDDLINN